jgi:murein L,D-transpeptidase YcbB/YkuD
MLLRPVPVYLTYLTAAPSGQGVQFLPDVYERDGM